MKKSFSKDMLGTKLKVGDHIGYASTRMYNGMMIFRLTDVSDQSYIQAVEVEWTKNMLVKNKKVRLRYVGDRAIVLKDYKEKS